MQLKKRQLSDIILSPSNISLISCILSQLLLYLRNVKWKTNTGVKMFFDENGDPPGPHELIIWERDENGKIIFKKIGHYDSDASPDKKLFLNPDDFFWNGGTTKVNLLLNL